MELGFLIIMLGICFLVVTFLYLTHTNEHRKCENCKFFHTHPSSSISGTCKGSAHRFKWDTGCREWKRKPIKYLEEE